MPHLKLSFLIILTLPLVLTACPNNTAAEHPGTLGDASGPTPDALSTVVIVTSTNPLGTACGSATDCASGFCTDGVCCDSACAETCYACNQQAAVGHCAALTSGQDPNATSPCVGTSACFLAATGTSVPACSFVDGTACESDGDCVSGHCLTYYVDADGDGYGAPAQARFCEEIDAPPPAGYAAYAGDCCDLDSGANPAFNTSEFLEMPDACGSFDWNCDGIITMQNPTCPGQTIQCGQPCYSAWGGLPDTSEPPYFVEACH